LKTFTSEVDDKPAIESKNLRVRRIRPMNS
jgi:hypothetical protein